MKTDRRSLLKTAAAALGTLALPGALAAASSASTPPRQRVGLDPIGVQLFTVRKPLQQDFDGTLARIAAIGYREVELAGFYGRTALQVRRSLDQAGLDAPSGHVSIETLGDRWEEVVEDAHTIGQRYVVISSIDNSEPMTLDAYRRAAERFNRAAETAANAGIHFAYHNHGFEFVPLEDRVPYDLLLEATDPKLVSFEMDFYWIFEAGGDPQSYLERWPGRIKLAHLKDSVGAPQHRMADVGAGVIDWHAILSHRQWAGMEHWFVERDDAPDPFDNVAASYRYLRSL